MYDRENKGRDGVAPSRCPSLSDAALLAASVAGVPWHTFHAPVNLRAVDGDPQVH